MSKIYNGILELIGNTPLMELKKIEQEEQLEARLFLFNLL